MVAYSKVLFDASNLVAGGGVQVAASLVDEISKLQTDPATVARYPWINSMHFLISPEVSDNRVLTTETATVTEVRRSKVYDFRRWIPERQLAEVHFVVFGPRYGRRRGMRTVVGIADGTSFYAKQEGIPRESLYRWIKSRVRSQVSRVLFSREDFVVSESASLLEAFHRRTGFDASKTETIPNVLNRAITEPSLRRPLPISLKDYSYDETFLIGYVARLYPHKNHIFLVALAEQLAARETRVKFVVTLSDSEWESATPEFREVCVNVGVVPIEQVADLNLQCDAMIFPSLLESHSAAPMEALSTNGLLFASDRPFVRDSAGDAPVYIDPLDSVTAADKIHATLHDLDRVIEIRRSARKLTNSLPGPRDRALSYLGVIDRLLVAGEVITENTSEGNGEQ